STKAWKVPVTAALRAPRWSPDGSLLAVEGWDKSGSNVYTIKPDGSDRQLVLRDAWSPTWSPDGKRLAVVRAETGTLVIVDTDGSDPQQVTLEPGTASNVASEPVWSPDGKWIAFVGLAGAVELVSPNGDDRGVRTIAKSGSEIAWSPDSTKIAFDTGDEVVQ